MELCLHSFHVVLDLPGVVGLLSTLQLVNLVSGVLNLHINGLNVQGLDSGSDGLALLVLVQQHLVLALIHRLLQLLQLCVLPLDLEGGRVGPDLDEFGQTIGSLEDTRLPTNDKADAIDNAVKKGNISFYCMKLMNFNLRTEPRVKDSTSFSRSNSQ